MKISFLNSVKLIPFTKVFGVDFSIFSGMLWPEIGPYTNFFGPYWPEAQLHWPGPTRAEKMRPLARPGRKKMA